MLGAEDVTFYGEGFDTDPANVAITIDGIACAIKTANLTAVTCTTGPRPGLVNTSLEIRVANKGLASLQGQVFTYANYWSEPTTWGGEFAPMHMESVWIPSGLNLLVDVDSTPELNAILVEGTLIFAPNETDPNHHRTFDARYIYVREGLMQVGTEERPYTSRLTITLHGNVRDPYIPIYGNKVIALERGTLDMHGVPRTPTWTTLEKTASRGSR